MKKSPFVIAAAVLSSVAQCRAAAPVSGYLETATKTYVSQGKSVIAYTRKWFSGRNTRTEIWHGEQLKRVEVDGPISWTAFPEAGCIMETPKWLRKDVSFVEQARQHFSSYGKSAPVEADLKGIRCWKYTEHVKERPAVGDILGNPAYDIASWIYADSEFPVLLQYEPSPGIPSELIDFKPGNTVPDDLFKKPDNLNEISPFKLTTAPFTLEIEENYVVTKHQPGATIITEKYSGDGRIVTRNYSSTTKFPNGRETAFWGQPQTSQYQNFKLSNPLRVDFSWDTVKRVGQDSLPLGTADIFETISDGGTLLRFWVVNHRQWGSIVVKQTREMQDAIITSRVTKLEIGEGAFETRPRVVNTPTANSLPK